MWKYLRIQKTWTLINILDILYVKQEWNTQNCLLRLWGKFSDIYTNLLKENEVFNARVLGLFNFVQMKKTRLWASLKEKVIYAWSIDLILLDPRSPRIPTLCSASPLVHNALRHPICFTEGILKWKFLQVICSTLENSYLLAFLYLGCPCCALLRPTKTSLYLSTDTLDCVYVQWGFCGNWLLRNCYAFVHL